MDVAKDEKLSRKVRRQRTEEHVRKALTESKRFDEGYHSSSAEDIQVLGGTTETSKQSRLDRKARRNRIKQHNEKLLDKSVHFEKQIVDMYTEDDDMNSKITPSSIDSVLDMKPKLRRQISVHELDVELTFDGDKESERAEKMSSSNAPMNNGETKESAQEILNSVDKKVPDMTRSDGEYGISFCAQIPAMEDFNGDLVSESIKLERKARLERSHKHNKLLFNRYHRFKSK